MQATKREVLDTGRILEVHLCDKELTTGAPYLITKDTSSPPNIIVLAHIDSFPATVRVKASYEVSFPHGVAPNKEILLAVFSIINEAYLSYTEQLIMEAGKDAGDSEETLS